jgi:hypothetical protein
VEVIGKGKDIMVRLFRAEDYDRWLKKRGGVRAEPFYTSPRARAITLNQDLPPGGAVVLLLDNGYSIRTAKQVTCQLQIRFERGVGVLPDDGEGGAVQGSPTSGSTAGTPTDSVLDDLPPPRTNSDEELPPPPPPPPENY